MPFEAGRRVDESPAVEDGVLVLEDVAIVRELPAALASRDVTSPALSRSSLAESGERTMKTTKKIMTRQTTTTKEPITAIIKNGDFEPACALVAAD